MHTVQGEGYVHVCTNPGNLVAESTKLYTRRLIFVGSPYETCLSHHSGTSNFYVAFRFLEDLYTSCYDSHDGHW